MPDQFPFSSLLPLFAKLDAITYEGVSLGSAPANFLRQDFTLTPGQNTWRQTLKARFNRFRYYHGLAHKQQYTQPGLPEGAYLFNLVSLADTRFTEFMLPMIEILPDKKAAFITHVKKDDAVKEIDTILFDGLNKEEHRQWLSGYRLIRSQVHQTVNDLQKEYGFSAYAKEELLSSVVYYTQSIFKNKKLLAAIKPACVITDHDQQFENAALITSANALGIPTFTLVHGSTFPLNNYLPLKATYVLCWGALHQRQFVEAGYKADRMLLCGNPKIRETTNKTDRDIALPFTIPGDKLVCILASNKIDISDRLLFLRTFREAIKQTGAFGIHKMHPLETTADYTDAGMPASELEYSLDKNGISSADAIAIADVIVCHNTNFALDTLLAGKPVIILDCITYHLGIGEVLIKEAGCPHAKNAAELAAILQRMQSDKAYSEELKNRAVRFAKELCIAKGDDAAQLTIQKIERTIKGSA